MKDKLIYILIGALFIQCMSFAGCTSKREPEKDTLPVVESEGKVDTTEAATEYEIIGGDSLDQYTVPPTVAVDRVEEAKESNESESAVEKSTKENNDVESAAEESTTESNEAGSAVDESAIENNTAETTVENDIPTASTEGVVEEYTGIVTGENETPGDPL